MVVIGGYDDSMKRLGVQSWQVGEGFAPTYHFDMLQDRRRNEAYRRGIEQTVEEDDLVVDIGTGSGLLAMMAAGAGAQHVFAIEGDPKLEKAARLVIEDNRYEEKVTVIGKHSTEVKVGYGLDVPFGANVIVTEIFDSFMLGEGMVPTMHDAVKRGLLAEGGRVIPAGGRMHCVLIESDWIRRHETLRGQDLLGSVEEVKRASVEHAREAARKWTFEEPIQVHANMMLARKLARQLSRPFIGQIFDFAHPKLQDQRSVSVEVMEDGTVDAILIWWTLDMEGTGAVQLSTEPEGYGRGGFEDERDGYPPPEREHWRQAACVLPAAVEVVKGDLLQVVCGHKECYPRFMVRKSYDDATKDLEGEFLPFEAPSKDCVQYPFLRRCHILQLSCQERENSYISVVCDLINKSLDKGDPSQDTLKVLLLGDGPLLPIAAAKAITDLRQEESERRMRISVVSLQSSLDACELANMAVKGRNQEGAIKVVAVVEKGQTFDGSMTEAVCSAASRELQGGRFDVVLAEPSYHALAVGGAGGTWAVDEFLRFWQEITALRDNGLLQGSCSILPCSFSVTARAFECEEMWRRKQAELEEAEGVKLHKFNEFNPRKGGKGRRSDMSDLAIADSLPWEGSMKFLSPPQVVTSFSSSSSCEPFEKDESLTLASQGVCHGVVFSAKICLTDDDREVFLPEKILTSENGYFQALHTFEEPKHVTSGQVLNIRTAISERTSSTDSKAQAVESLISKYKLLVGFSWS